MSRVRTTATTASIATGTRSPARPPRPRAWLDEWVYGVSGRAEYVEKLGTERVASLRPSGAAPSGSVDYGVSDERAARRRSRRGSAAGVPGAPASAFSKSEMMIVAAARELAGQRVCFVGVGLAEHRRQPGPPHGRPQLELVYESGAFGAVPARLPSRSATRPSSPAQRPSSRCSSCSASTCRAGWSTSAFSAPPRSTASATSTDTVIGRLRSP